MEQHLTIRKLHILALAICLVVVLAACQPTPEEIVVQDKKDSIEEVVKENKDGIQKDDINDETAAYETPETYTNTYEKRNVKVIVDAEIEVPTQIIPSVMLKPKELTQELADEFSNYFIGDAQLYKRKIGGLIADDYKDKILSWQKVRFNAETKWEEVKDHDPYAGNGSQQGALQYFDNEIKRLEELLKKAPEEHEYMPISRQIEILVDEGGKDIPENATPEQIAAAKAADKEAELQNAGIMHLEGYAEVAVSDIDDNMANVYMKGEKGKGARLSYDNMNSAHYHLRFNEIQELGKTISISLVEAIKLAEKEMEGLGIGETYLSQVDYGAIKKNGEPAPCYRFIFNKSINGIPILQLQEGQIDSRSYIVAPPPIAELVDISVDESGVLALSWSCLAQQIEVLDEDVNVMSFEEALSLFEDKIFYEAYSPENDLEIVIKKISLTLMPIKMKDSDNTVTVPVWDFRGYHYDPNDIEQKNKVIGWNLDNTYLTINAIDGSIIDRSLGY